MAKTSYLGANIAVATDTFREWVERTNQLVYDQGTIVITAGAVALPNSTNHTITSGNGHVNGIFSANTLVAKDNIRVNTVCPTFVLTPMVKGFFKNKKFKKEAIKKIPLGRVAEESDVATAVAFLAADSSAMITGTSLVVDGGWTAQ